MNGGMDGNAFLFMTISWFLVLLLNFFCFGRLFFGGDKNKKQ